MVYSTTSDVDSAIFAWTVETMGRVVGRSQAGAPEEWTACERRKRIICSKTLVQCTELVMFVTIKKNNDKCEIQNCVDPTRYQVDGSNKVVVGGTSERVSKFVLCVAC